ncbi:MAG TPA: hypothetical protein VJU80_03755, partial [Solirubrobacteraceae bacterium]|nr:hypothetical protein [Solirubrobacteraceae bacterium]
APDSATGRRGRRDTTVPDHSVHGCLHASTLGAGLIAWVQPRWHAHATVDERSREQVGSALRRLAQELAAERRRLALLERENRGLRAQLKVAEATLREPNGGRPTLALRDDLVESAGHAAVRRGYITTSA